MAKNMLTDEQSPYLKQYRDDPVCWYTWGEAALTAAKSENKPILLSVGFRACHLCNAMAQESFSDPQTAELMNRFFINITVDKDERPDLDTLYQDALYLFSGIGGWPLTLFLTPDGLPFFGGTYFPAEEKNGLPSFRQVLWQTATLWRQNPQEVLKRGAETAVTLKNMGLSKTGRETMPQEKINELTLDVLSLLDPDYGGFGAEAKFPHVPVLTLMWQSRRCIVNQMPHQQDEQQDEDKKQARILEAGVRLTLDRICQGGLFDHIRGGFFRFCTDSQWQNPHFEKTLTDNALLLELLTTVWQDVKNPLYKDRAEKTAMWMLAEMQLDPQNPENTGGFITALSAETDSDDVSEKSRFYLWTPQELRNVLGKDADKFMAAYGVDKSQETPQHLTRLHVTAWDAAVDKDMQKLREALLQKQNERSMPQRDDKILAEANGFALAALARAGAAFERPDWINTAQTAFSFIEKSHGTEGGLLYHSWCAGHVKKLSLAEDYAAMAYGAFALYEVTADRQYLEKAQAWIYQLMAGHEDLIKGGFFRTEKTNKDLFMPLKSAKDGATPSANAVALQVLAQLFNATNSKVWQEQAKRVFGAFSGDIQAEVFAFTGLLRGQSLLVNPPETTVEAMLLPKKA